MQIRKIRPLLHPQLMKIDGREALSLLSPDKMGVKKNSQSVSNQNGIQNKVYQETVLTS